jgi:hypothetical protein
LLNPHATRSAIRASAGVSVTLAGATGDPAKLCSCPGRPQRRAEPVEDSERLIQRLARGASLLRTPLRGPEQEQRPAELERHRGDAMPVPCALERRLLKRPRDARCLLDATERDEYLDVVRHETQKARLADPEHRREVRRPSESAFGLPHLAAGELDESEQSQAPHDVEIRSALLRTSEKRSSGSLGVRHPALMGVDERCRVEGLVPVDARVFGELDALASKRGRILPAPACVSSEVIVPSTTERLLSSPRSRARRRSFASSGRAAAKSPVVDSAKA